VFMYQLHDGKNAKEEDSVFSHHLRNLIVLSGWFDTFRQCALFVCLGVILVCANISFAVQADRSRVKSMFGVL
jgi:hypothetical protein